MINMKKLVQTILGEFDLELVENMKLRKVIKQRVQNPSFLFNYGDGTSHTDNHSEAQGHSELGGGYLCSHNDSHTESGYNETTRHQEHTEYPDYSDHSEYKESKHHTDYTDRT